jgi:hypothetical protein
MSPRTPSRRGRRFIPAVSSGAEVQVRIERLLLHGVTQAEAGQIAQALAAELSRLVAEPAQVFASVSAPRAPLVHFQAAEGPERIGRAAAAALWSGVQKTQGARS